MMTKQDKLIIKQGETIPILKEGKYIISLERHNGSLVGPLIEMGNVEKRAVELGYYRDTALEDIELTGPFRYLNLARGN